MLSSRNTFLSKPARSSQDSPLGKARPPPSREANIQDALRQAEVLQEESEAEATVNVARVETFARVRCDDAEPMSPRLVQFPNTRLPPLPPTPVTPPSPITFRKPASPLYPPSPHYAASQASAPPYCYPDSMSDSVVVWPAFPSTAPASQQSFPVKYAEKPWPYLPPKPSKEALQESNEKPKKRNRLKSLFNIGSAKRQAPPPSPAVTHRISGPLVIPGFEPQLFGGFLQPLMRRLNVEHRDERGARRWSTCRPGLLRGFVLIGLSLMRPSCP
jgi:hypothetical protein